MIPDTAILLPPIALALLTGFAAVRMLSTRIHEMRAHRIHPNHVALSSQAAQKFQDTRAADNFRNLFEMPVLFYVLCGFLAITKLTTPFLLACAWGYVVLRVCHSWIHLTNNKVIRRFQVFVASTIVLYVMWGMFAVRLLLAE